MKIITAIFVTFAVGALIFATPEVKNTENLYEGLCVVEFNAGFNSQNSVPWIEELTDCMGRRVDISSSPAEQADYSIVVVPTIIIFNDGQEVKRYQANIMMELDVQKETIQEDIDEIIMGEF